MIATAEAVAVKLGFAEAALPMYSELESVAKLVIIEINLVVTLLNLVVGLKHSLQEVVTLLRAFGRTAAPTASMASHPTHRRQIHV